MEGLFLSLIFLSIFLTLAYIMDFILYVCDKLDIKEKDFLLYLIRNKR